MTRSYCILGKITENWLCPSVPNLQAISPELPLVVQGRHWCFGLHCYFIKDQLSWKPRGRNKRQSTGGNKSVCNRDGAAANPPAPCPALQQVKDWQKATGQGLAAAPSLLAVAFIATRAPPFFSSPQASTRAGLLKNGGGD